MKNRSTIFSVLALGALTVLGACNQKSKNAETGSASNTPSVASPAAQTTRIAYVNIDSLESQSILIKNKKEEFKKRQDAMEAELQRSYQQMQSDAMEVQRKAQANNLTQSEYEAAQKRLGQMQQSLETRKQALTDQLLKDQEDFNRQLKESLDSFLADYNKDKHYDYILSYAADGSILYANKALDITADVIKGMNANMASNDTDKKNK